MEKGKKKLGIIALKIGWLKFSAFFIAGLVHRYNNDTNAIDLAILGFKKTHLFESKDANELKTTHDGVFWLKRLKQGLD